MYADAPHTTSILLRGIRSHTGNGSVSAENNEKRKAGLLIQALGGRTSPLRSQKICNTTTFKVVGKVTLIPTCNERSTLPAPHRTAPATPTFRVSLDEHATLGSASPQVTAEKTCGPSNQRRPTGKISLPTKVIQHSSNCYLPKTGIRQWMPYMVLSALATAEPVA